MNATLWALGAVFALTVSGAAAGPLDGEAIQRRLDALGERGGTVRLAAGTYLIRSTLWLDNNVTLQGAGMDKTILRLAPRVGNAAAVMTRNFDENKKPEGNHDITLRDLTVNGNAAENPKLVSGAICLPNCYNYRIERVRVVHSRGYAGIYTNPNHAAARAKVPYQNFIVDCVVEETLPKLFGPDDPDKNPYGHGIYVTAWDNENVLLRGNVCRNNHGAGIHIEDNVECVFVEENECYGNGHCGIWAVEAARSVFRFNHLHHNGESGLDLVQGKGLYDNLVLGNEIHHNRGPGITMSRHYGPGDSRQVILGNRLWDNGEAGISVRETARANFIAFNYIYDDQPEPTQKHGIILDSTGNQVIRNYVTGGYRLAEGNTLEPWPQVPWTPQNLVAGYYPPGRWAGCRTGARACPTAQPRAAVLHSQGAPAPYPGEEGRLDLELCIATFESARRSGAVDLPLREVTPHEEAIHQAFRERYGYEPF